MPATFPGVEFPAIRFRPAAPQPGVLIIGCIYDSYALAHAVKDALLQVAPTRPLPGYDAFPRIYLVNVTLRLASENGEWQGSKIRQIKTYPSCTGKQGSLNVASSISRPESKNGLGRFKTSNS
jgi:predicted ATP-grasp superfamily ATP-dependent carboligase